MKKRQASVAARHRQQQHKPKDLEVSPKKDASTRTSGRTRQRNRCSRQSAFSWYPDSFCSDSDRTVVSKDAVKPFTSPASGVVDLTGMSNREHEHSEDAIPTSCEEIVLLSAGEEDKILQSESGKPRQSCFSPVQFEKISLPMDSVAKDTLKTLRLNKDSPGVVPFRPHNESPKCFDSQLDDTNSVASGPSSPCTALASPRCRECKKLFTKMRRQGPTRTRKEDNDPANLSCDVWLLIKSWQPQRRRQVKGRLWVHLKRIRKLAVELLAAAVTQTACSRPHVFLQRNLRRCREMSSMLGGPSQGKAKPHHRRRLRAKYAWPSVSAKYQKSNKKKPSDASGFLDKQRGCDSLEHTRRVLKFDDALNMLPTESQKPRQGFAQKRAGGEQYEGLADFTLKKHTRAEKVLSEALEEFRTPPIISSEETKIVRRSRPTFFSSGRSPHEAQKGSFRSMLAAFEKSHNQIIKESHN